MTLLASFFLLSSSLINMYNVHVHAHVYIYRDVHVVHACINLHVYQSHSHVPFRAGIHQSPIHPKPGQKPASPVQPVNISPDKGSPNKSPPQLPPSSKGFNPNAPTFVPMGLQGVQRPANVRHSRVQHYTMTFVLVGVHVSWVRVPPEAAHFS